MRDPDYEDEVLDFTLLKTAGPGYYLITVHKPETWASNPAPLHIQPPWQTKPYIVVYVDYFEVIWNNEDVPSDPAEIVWLIAASDGNPEHTALTRFPVADYYMSNDQHQVELGLPIFAMPLEEFDEETDRIQITMKAWELDPESGSDPGWLEPALETLGEVAGEMIGGTLFGERDAEAGKRLGRRAGEAVADRIGDQPDECDSFGTFGYMVLRGNSRQLEEWFDMNGRNPAYIFNAAEPTAEQKMFVHLTITLVDAPRVTDFRVTVNPIRVDNISGDVYLRMRAYDDVTLGNIPVEAPVQHPPLAGSFAMHDGEFVPEMPVEIPYLPTEGH